MVKISDLGAKDAFGLDDIPALVYFENGIPELYEGDLRNDQGADSIMESPNRKSPHSGAICYTPAPKVRKLTLKAG